MATSKTPLVLLFGYHSSPFTQKLRLALRLKQIPYTFITVSSMMPRPVLRDSFHLTYRRIPILAIGRDVYCDTSIIIEALEQAFPSSSGFGTLYPKDGTGRSNRSLIRGFVSFWTDKPFYRHTTGLIPPSVWRTHFGVDRSELIGHKLDAVKLGAKIPLNLSGLDTHLSMLEVQLSETSSRDPWIFGGAKPSAADVGLYYQLDWGNDIAKGKGIENLTGGGTKDEDGEGAASVFNQGRYPAVWSWFHRLKEYIASLPDVESRIEGRDEAAVKNAIEQLNRYPKLGAKCMLTTPAAPHAELDSKIGLTVGQQFKVSISPDDTGKANPTIGTLIGLSSEEIVIEPVKLDGKEAVVDVAVHFPRLGSIVKPVREAQL
jgi:glutathione S-transferase